MVLLVPVSTDTGTALVLYCCRSNVIHMGQETWAIRTAVKKYSCNSSFMLHGCIIKHTLMILWVKNNFSICNQYFERHLYVWCIKSEELLCTCVYVVCHCYCALVQSGFVNLAVSIQLHYFLGTYHTCTLEIWCTPLNCFNQLLCIHLLRLVSQ